MAVQLSKYRGRAAHVGRSSRQNSAWDTPIEAIYETVQGNVTKSQYLAARQRASTKERFSMVLGNLTDSVFTRRSCSCGGDIRYGKDGKAVCTNPSCSTIFNDGGNTDGLIKVTKFYSHSNRTDISVDRCVKPRNGSPGRSHLGKILKASKA